MEKANIEIGDKVDVYFENTYPLKDVEVLSIPTRLSDKIWKFKSENGNIHYVQQFSEVRWVKPFDKDTVANLPW